MFLDSVTRLTLYVLVSSRFVCLFVCLFVGFFGYHHSIPEIRLYANVNQPLMNFPVGGGYAQCTQKTHKSKILVAGKQLTLGVRGPGEKSGVLISLRR